MFCPKCHATALRREAIGFVDHGQSTMLVSCVICGNIVSDEVMLNVSVRDMRSELYVNRPRRKRKKLTPIRVCSEPGCEARVCARNLCNKHYQQHLRQGTGFAAAVE